MMFLPKSKSLLLVACALAVPSVALAQRGGWGGGYGGGAFGSPYGRDFDRGSYGGRDRSREGKISVSRFVSDDPLAAGLGHGAIMVRSGTPGHPDFDQLDRETFEAAFVDRLAKAGYDTRQSDAGSGGQVVELSVIHTELEPPEPPHKPISGEATIGASNRGMGYGLAIGVDLTKPLPPLISTRIEVRIRDRATQTVLWEGHAEVATRPGAKGWTSQQTAARLAAALLDGFPHAADKVARPG